MLIVSILTIAGTFHVRNEVIRFALTLTFTLHQVFIHFFFETNTVWIHILALLKFILPSFLDHCNQMVTQIVSGRVFLVCFLSAFFRVFTEYHNFVKCFPISPASMLIVRMFTVVGTFNIRNKIIRYALTLAFALHQIFIHFLLETNTV